MSEYDSDCRTLEVEPGASLEEIRQAYLDQTKIWHPDRFSNDIRLQKKAEEKLKQINLAYQRLCGGGPYEPPVLNRSTERSPSEWVAVFVALRRALRKSVLAITKPFVLLVAKTVNVSNWVFQWCHRQRRSLGIATTAFLLGFVLGVWFSPHKSETWAKINNLRQKIIEKARGTAQVAGAKPSPTAPTVLSQRELLTASSAETAVPALPIARPSGDVFPWKRNVVTTIFWVGEEQVTGKTSPQHQSAWDKDWLKNFGGVDNPEPAARHDYIPISFVPRQNPFYCALPYNDVEHGQFKPEAPIVIPWFKQVHTGPGQSVCKDRWVGIRKGDRICYAQWEDCGPFRTDHFQYVFQNERPTPNASHGAGLSVSPAVRDHLGLAPTDVADWRFVEVSDVPPGPWRNYGENNHFVIARRQLEKGFAEQKESANPAATKPAQGAPAPRGSVISPSAAKALTTYAPRPEYPQEARSHRIAGSGVCVVSVHPASGSVTNASMAQSTGSPLLDKSVLSTVRTWKFKPRTVSKVSIPVEFTMAGEQR